jgi:site-specific recombinase XerD
VAGVSDFRFHDFRHDFATKLLRETRNLKLVQKALNHADIKTTTKYAHVVDDDLVAGLDAMQKSRRKFRKPVRDAS